MSAKVLAGYVTSEALQKVFKQMARPGALLILEGLTDLQMQRLKALDDLMTQGIDPVVYEEGRMFAGGYELYWQRMRGYPSHVPPFRVRLICDDVQQLTDVDCRTWCASSGESPKALPLTYVGSDAFFLWGEAVRGTDGNPTGDWYEKEVPRLFRYPIDCAEETRRVKLVTKTYKLLQADDTKAGGEEEAVMLHRFSAIVPAQE